MTEGHNREGEIKMSMLPIREFDKKQDHQRVEDFFAQMGGESRGFFNRGGGNEKTALSFFDDCPPDEIKNTVYFMALDGERMAGYLFLWDTDKSIPWLGVAVAEDWKGRHLGRDLMKHADQYAMEHDKGGILLATSQANLRGQGLYMRYGYEHIGLHTSGELLFLKRY